MMNKILSQFSGLRARLMSALIVPFVCFAALGFMALRNVEIVKSEIHNAYDNALPSQKTMERISGDFERVSALVQAALIAGFDRDALVGKAHKALQALDTDFTQFAKLQSDGSLASSIKSMTPIKDQFVKTYTEQLNLLAEKKPDSDSKVRTFIIEKPAAIFAEIEGKISEIQKALDAETTSALSSVDLMLGQQTIWISIVGGLSIFMLVGMLVLTANRVTNWVSSLSNKIEESGLSMADSIQRLSSSGQTLAHSSTASAGSLQQTVASLEELTSMVRLNSDHAKQAASLSQASRDAAEQGEREIQSLITSMKGISDSSKQIEEIIGVIDDIAFQTNLLALNAAVEAARAGEQGKGFAVVAEAVRSLAQRSASAAHDIADLIKDSVSKIDHGTKIADKGGAVLGNIVTSVKKVADLNNEIATASTEQSDGIGLISKAMNQLDQTVQSNASSSQEIAQTTQEISHQAETTRKHVMELHEFILGVQKNESSTAIESGKSNDPKSGKGNLKKLPPRKSVATSKGTSRSATASKSTSKATATASPPTPPSKAGATKSANVSELRPRPINTEQGTGVIRPRSASDLIPFDDEEPRGKIGSAEGF